jgi:tetratricopeptide (TPR) repeat protein
MLLAWALERQGNFDGALTELNIAYRINDTPQVLASLGHLYATSGNPVEARRVLAELAESARHRYVSPYDVATIHAGLKDKQASFGWLERAYEERSGWLPLWLRVDPRFGELRSDPRFRDLLRRIGNPT